MILQILLVFILIALLSQISNIYRLIRLCFIYSKLPGPQMFPIFGVAVKVALLKETEILDFFETLTKNRRSTSIMMVGRPYTALRYPPDLERAMANTVHITKGLEYNTLMMWLNEGLLTSRNSKWHRRRKILTPTFHFKILEDSLPIMNNNAKKMAHKLLSHNNQPLDIDQFITLCSLDIICETAMGIKLNSQENDAIEYVSDIKRVCCLMIHKEQSFWLRNSLLLKLSPTGRELGQVISRLQKFTEKVIADRKKIFEERNNSLENKGKKRMAFLDCLIDMEKNNPGTFCDTDIREEVDTFMFEGHDTTSTALVFCLLLLGHHKDVQEKAVNELKEIFDDSDRPVTIKDLQSMKYLEMVIKETLRLFPSVPCMSRFLTKDLQLENGTVIPASTNLLLLPFHMHRDSKLFEQPEKFMPERFTEENSKKRHPFSYIPFSAGPRNCIGQKFAMMEMKVIVSTVLRYSELESVTPMESIKLKPLLILRPDRTVEVKFSPRSLNQ